MTETEVKKFIGWCNKIGEHQSLTYTRKRRRWNREDLILNRQIGNDTGNELIDYIAEDNEYSDFDKVYIAMMLLDLPYKERIVIKEIFFNEKTERQLAQYMGLSQQTINRIKKKALCHLRKIVNEK